MKTVGVILQGSIVLARGMSGVFWTPCWTLPVCLICPQNEKSQKGNKTTKQQSTQPFVDCFMYDFYENETLRRVEGFLHMVMEMNYLFRNMVYIHTAHRPRGNASPSA